MSDTQLEKILIIDDNSDYRKLINTFISKLLPGVEVLEYDPVFEGVPDDNFDWSEIDVLLLDYHLSIVGTTGLDILHKHHKKISFPATIMLTGAGTEEIAIRALKSGIYEYQPKQTLTKDKLKQSVIHAWEEKKSERKKKQEATQHNRSFSKEVFYENLERAYGSNTPERALVIIRPDNIDTLESEIGIIGRDNLVNHIAKHSFEVFKLGACNPNITRISDTEIGIQIDYPINKETLEFNMKGLCEHLAKCTFRFSEEKYQFSISIGVLKLGIFNKSAEQLIYIATTACDHASKTEGNSHYTWKETDVAPEFIEHTENQFDEKSFISTLKATEESQAALRIADEKRLEAELKAREEEEAKLQAKLVAEQEAEEAKAQEKLRAEQEAKEKAEAEMKAAKEEKEKLEAELKAKEEEAKAQAILRAEQEAKEKAEAEEKIKAAKEEKEKLEAELKAKEEEAKAQAILRAEQEAKEKAEAEEKIKAAKEKAEAEAEVKAAKEEKEKLEAELKAKEEEAKAQAILRTEQEAKEKAEAEEKIKVAKEEKERLEAELKAKEEEAKAQAKLRAEKEAKEKAEAEEKIKAAKEEKEKLEAELKAKEEEAKAQAILRAEQEAKEKAAAEAEMKAAKEEKEKLEAELKAIAQAKADAEAEMKAAKEEKEKLEAELKAIAQAKADAETSTDKQTTETNKEEPKEAQKENQPEKQAEPEERKTDITKSNESEPSVEKIEAQIKKLIGEKKIIQTYQPITAMFSDDEDTKEMYMTGLQSIIESDELNEYLLDTSVFSISLQQIINEWILRQVFLRITESGTTNCQYLFLISVTESWFSDITLFQWLQKILSQTKKYNPGKSIILNVPLDIFIKHQKRAEPLINTLRKSHQFTIALSNVHTVGNIDEQCKLTSPGLLMVTVEQLKKLSETLAPDNNQSENDEDETEKQNLLQYLKSKKIKVITSGIEDSTLLTDAITAGTDFTLGNFVGEVQDNLVESSMVESFELT
jgi:CheY-like chemotaxis protein